MVALKLRPWHFFVWWGHLFASYINRRRGVICKLLWAWFMGIGLGMASETKNYMENNTFIYRDHFMEFWRSWTLYVHSIYIWLTYKVTREKRISSWICGTLFVNNVSNRLGYALLPSAMMILKFVLSVNVELVLSSSPCYVVIPLPYLTPSLWVFYQTSVCSIQSRSHHHVVRWN